MLADRVRARLAAPAREARSSIDNWITDFLVPASLQGLTTTYPGGRVTEISNTLPSYAAALRGCPPAFAAQMVRALVLSQARFTFRRRASTAKPGRTFGGRSLSVLERPWPNGTTGQMLTTMEWHAGLAGNSYVTNRSRGRLRVLRPDWVAIIYGSHQEPEDAAFALDGELIGYAYANGGLIAPGNGTLTGIANRVHTLLPDEVAHYTAAGLTDPEGGGIGMSWVTPALRDMQSDKAATEHKLQFWRNGAPQPLTARVLTPTGWSTMGEMRVGGRVIGADGRPHEVTAIHPQGEQDIYRVDFIDGSSAECTLDHVWTVSNLYDRKRGVSRDMTLTDLIADGFRYDSGEAKWAVPLVEPVEYDETTRLPLDPYLLGLLLGDGSFRSNGRGSGGVSLACAAWDADETIEIITPMLPAGVSISRRNRVDDGRGQCSELYFRRPHEVTERNWHGHIKAHAPNPLTAVIAGLGLFDVIGKDKFVPEMYLRAAVKDRIAILQGLLDSDGHVEPTGLRFTTTSRRLAEAVVELTASLGGTATVRPVKNRTTMTVNIRQLPDWIVPVRLLRKATAYRVMDKPRIRTIVGATKVRREQAQCIAVDSPDHLYVTDDFVLTHNSPNLVVKGIPAMDQKQFNEIVDMIESNHTGVRNAFKTLYLTAGADATIVGSNFQQMDLKNITALGETRISFLSRVPASLLGISEGLAGSSLNAGNFDSARRVFADTWVSPTLQDYAASLAPLVEVPNDAELWPETADMPILRDDSKAAAEIEQMKQASIVAYVNAGFTPESAVQAVATGDVSLLKHTDLLSVQLQAPGTTPPGTEPPPGQG